MLHLGDMLMRIPGDVFKGMCVAFGAWSIWIIGRAKPPKQKMHYSGKTPIDLYGHDVFTVEDDE